MDGIDEFIDKIRSKCKGYYGFDIKKGYIYMSSPESGLTHCKDTCIRIKLDDNYKKWEDVESTDDIDFVDVGEAGREAIIFGDGSVALSKFPIEDIEIMFRCSTFSISEIEYAVINYVRTQFLSLIDERNAK